MKSKFVSLLRYLVARRFELSTLQGGIVAGAASLGYALNPEHVAAYLQGAIAVAGFLGVFCPDTFGSATDAQAAETDL